MRAIALLLLSLGAPGGVFASHASSAGDPTLKPLWAYDGTWKLTRASQSAGAKPEILINRCSESGRFFTCEQTVNGGPGSLLVIVPGGSAGHYSTQTILSDGRATGLDQLDIAGDQWTFTSRRQDQPGKIVYRRTVNSFSGRTRIHFEQDESDDGKKWVTRDSGDELRVSGAGQR